MRSAMERDQTDVTSFDLMQLLPDADGGPGAMSSHNRGALCPNLTRDIICTFLYRF